jgi:hypothetical protein
MKLKERFGALSGANTCLVAMLFSSVESSENVSIASLAARHPARPVPGF